jgi:hypothetical protein
MSRIYLIFTLLVSMTLLVANMTNPPDGRTGAPGDGLCSDCHSLGTGTQDGVLTIDGLPASIDASTAYVLTITNSNPNGDGVLAGFQLTVLNSSNQKAGVLSAPSPNSSVTNPAGARQWWEHNPAQPFPGTNMVSWTVTWTAPVGPNNTTITAYAAGNVANDNNNSTGDLIITTTASGTLIGGPPLEVNINTWTDVLCNGNSTGSATATAMGGTPSYSYLWSNGGNTATINNLPAGMYTVTVTDNGGSTATASVQILQPPAIVFQGPVINHVSCFGGSNGSITANATGGTPPFSYDWSNGDTGNSINGLSAGSYTVTATDDNNCTKTATYVVTQPAELNIELVNLSDESCFGEEDGAISILVTGGVNPIFAEWSNGFIGTTITDLAPDTYSVTVTDNNDCTATATYIINEGGVVNVSLEQIIHVSCNGGNNGSISVSAAGGEAPYTFNWSNGDSGPTITDLTAGSYLVTATDNNGCEVVKAYTVNQPPPITVQINATGQNLCAGNSNVDLTAVPTGTQPPFSGLWSNGTVGLVNNDLAAGVYTITVTDNAGCTATASSTVTAPSPLTVTVSATDETGVGSNDGTAEVSAGGGTPGYTYLWSTGSTADSIGGLAPGVYTVTVTDQNNCTGTGTGQVDAFGCNLNIDLGADVSFCEGDTIDLSLPPGFVSYLWSTGATTPSITVTTGGEICATVVDADGCSDADCIVLTEEIFPVVTCPVVNESLPGANDGAISCDSLSGNIQYLWSNGATTPSITGLAPGLYCVTMTNTNGCTDEQCFLVQAGNCQLVITSIITDVLCDGDSTGSVAVNIENATPPLHYLWSTGDTTATIENLPEGNYSMSVVDDALCFLTQTFSVNEPDPLVIIIDSIVDISILPGSVHISVSGGTAPYTYLWTFPDGSQVTDEDLNALSIAGFYNIAVTDANGCETGAIVLVDMDVAVEPTPVFKPIKVYPVPTSDILHVELDQEITEALIMGIDGRLQKRILNPASNNLQVGELEPGWYILRMTDGQSWYIARMVK